MSASVRVAFVHDWLTIRGGAERVLEVMLSIFPDAPIFTTIYNRERFADSNIAGHPVYVTFLDKMPLAHQRHRAYVPFMPFFVEQFDLQDYDIVISSSFSVAHGIIPFPHQLHINYIHSPARYAWHQYHQYVSNWNRKSGIRLKIARLFLHYFRLWDFAAAARVDYFIANSQWTARAIWRAYRRKARLIYPPVQTHLFEPASNRQDYYITVSRLVPYKRLELIVQTFRSLDFPLVIVGDGPEYRYLSRIATPNIKFIRHATDMEIAKLLSEAKAFIHTAEEDFGIAPMEAQAAGCPVIGFGKGGLRETIVEGKTGLFFHEQSEESLKRTVMAFNRGDYSFDSAQIRLNAERFKISRFVDEFTDMIEQVTRNQNFTLNGSGLEPGDNEFSW